jgi:hypothetical protein
MTTADQTLNDACHEVIATIRFGRKVGRDVPTTVLAMALQIAVEEAAPHMPVEPQHLGAVWELAS